MTSLPIRYQSGRPYLPNARAHPINRWREGKGTGSRPDNRNCIVEDPRAINELASDGWNKPSQKFGADTITYALSVVTTLC